MINQWKPVIIFQSSIYQNTRTKASLSSLMGTAEYIPVLLKTALSHCFLMLSYYL